MPSPRQIAEEKNRGENFDRTVEGSYDPEAGAPKADVPGRKNVSYEAGLSSLPPDPEALPAKNLKR